MALSIQTSSLSFSKTLTPTPPSFFLSTELSFLSIHSQRPPTTRKTTIIRMGGGPRTYPGGVSKWQWKRMQAKKAKQLLKARLARERQIYEMRKRAELKAAVSELERPWEVVEKPPNLFSVSADEQVKVLADRFQRPGGFDLWTARDGPQLFETPDGFPSARFFPKGVVHSVKPYGKIKGLDQSNSNSETEDENLRFNSDNGSANLSDSEGIGVFLSRGVDSSIPEYGYGKRRGDKFRKQGNRRRLVSNDSGLESGQNSFDQLNSDSDVENENLRLDGTDDDGGFWSTEFDCSKSENGYGNRRGGNLRKKGNRRRFQSNDSGLDSGQNSFDELNSDNDSDVENTNLRLNSTDDDSDFLSTECDRFKSENGYGNRRGGNFRKRGNIRRFVSNDGGLNSGKNGFDRNERGVNSLTTRGFSRSGNGRGRGYRSENFSDRSSRGYRMEELGDNTSRGRGYRSGNYSDRNKRFPEKNKYGSEVYDMGLQQDGSYGFRKKEWRGS